jgi:anti-sigma factor RsiW
MSPGITCQELVELVTDYVEGALGEQSRADFEAHLSTCPDCRAYVEQMRLTIRVVRELAYRRRH